MAKLKLKLKEWNTRLKNMPKSKQTKAFVRVIQFFALMLVLTIFAKGAAGVTMPRVKAVTPYSAQISETIEASGVVKSLGSREVEVPAGLTVSRVAAGLGTNVKEGDTLLEFDEDELRRSVITERANLRELELQLRELRNTSATDDESVQQAQEALDAARSTLSKSEERVNAAQAAVNTLNDEINWINNRIYELENPEPGNPDPDPSDPGDGSGEPSVEPEGDGDGGATDPGTSPPDASSDLEQLRALLTTKEEERRTAQADLDAAIDTRDTNKRAVSQAEKALEKAKENYEKQKETDAISGERNKVAIEKKQLEIEKQQELVNTLVAAQATGGALTAPVAGNISEITFSVGDVTKEDSRVRITTGQEGYMVEVPVTQTNAAQLQVGGALYVTRQNYWGSSEATITAKFYSNENNSMMIRATLPGNDWNVGDTVKLEVVLSRRQYYTCVPVSAVHSGQDGPFVYILQERKTVLGTQMVAVKENVTIEAQDSDNIAIQINTYNAQVLTASSKPINEGDRVRIEDTVNGV